jgi:transposase
MSLGRRSAGGKQESIWIETASLAIPVGHPFYDRLNGLLDKRGFDGFAENVCRSFYAKGGRPGLPPGVYFRCLLIGYFEGLGSERGIAWRAFDSLSLRAFLGFDLTEATPDHSTISRTRRLIDLETHRSVFVRVLGMLAEEGLLKGNTVSVDGTTLEANAALRSIVRRDSGEGYDEFLKSLAQESGIETPSREQLAKLDRKRKKKGSNDDWQNPHDPDAQITKMKDGRTHLAHKAEHAVDLETGALLAVTVQGGSEGDTSTVYETLTQCGEHIREAAADTESKAGTEQLNPEGPAELVLDKGYHSNDVLLVLQDAGVRSYCSEPDRGRRKWIGKEEEKAAVYQNRRRIRGERGKRLLRKRGELVERSFAHMYETGGMRRTHLRHRDNIAKRLLIHASAFNLSLIMRKKAGCGTPRGLQGRSNQLFSLVLTLINTVIHAVTSKLCRPKPQPVTFQKIVTSFRLAELWPVFGLPLFTN